MQTSTRSQARQGEAQLIGQDYLKECLDYSPATGVFVWRSRPPAHFSRPRDQKAWNNKLAGSVAGTVSRNRGGEGAAYRQIQIGGILYKAHRLAWLYMRGGAPCSDIDHIDGDGLANQFSNLREVTNTQNHQNMKRFSNNTTGVTGVYRSRAGKYVAAITANGRRRYLGSFSTLDDAAAIRKAAEVEHGFHENHGRAA